MRAADPTRNLNTVRGRRRIVNRLAAAADQRDELEVRQPPDQRARKSDPLADFDDAFGRLQPLDQLVEIARRRAIAGDLVGPRAA